jgi:hypothetical protein
MKKFKLADTFMSTSTKAKYSVFNIDGDTVQMYLCPIREGGENQEVYTSIKELTRLLNTGKFKYVKGE